MRRAGDNNAFLVAKGGVDAFVPFRSVYETENLVFNFLSKEDATIIRIVNEEGKHALRESAWALGGVTGNNKMKLETAPGEGLEKI